MGSSKSKWEKKCFYTFENQFNPSVNPFDWQKYELHNIRDTKNNRLISFTPGLPRDAGKARPKPARPRAGLPRVRAHLRRVAKAGVDVTPNLKMTK